MSRRRLASSLVREVNAAADEQLVTSVDYPEMSDDELTSAANEILRAYDERETGE